MRVLITGTAGFIGSQVASRLLERGDEVIGVDNLSTYYDVELKKARLARFCSGAGYTHVHADLANRSAIESVFERYKPQRVINLAAQAGVRYAAENPHVYVDSNVTGFLHVLEGCRNHGVEHLVFASTSSVYGANTEMPFSEHQSTEHPLTLYAATKKANEMMAHSYSHLYGIPATGLRFFTVYGPWGRPDMALFLFTKAILAGEPIKVFNNGNHARSFTYIDDIVQGVVRVLDRLPSLSRELSSDRSTLAKYQIFNIGNAATIPLMRYIEVLENELGRKAKIDFHPLQPGDVPATTADTSSLEAAVQFAPETSVEEGVRRFVEWYTRFYGVSQE